MMTGEWPELRYSEWSDTLDTLHMWTQIVGKTRLALSPLQAHWWNVPFYVSARGWSTAAMPYGPEMLEIEFDFVSHELRYRLSNGAILATPLRAQSVADFYKEYRQSLGLLGVSVEIDSLPCELKAPIRFEDDTQHASYDAEAAQNFWHVLVKVDKIFQEFSSRFIGKVSPVHFFWGSFDLAVTRFSGRRAPERPELDAVMREAYSHEVISAGFWPGNGGYGEAAFYCYAAPAPSGLDKAEIRPGAARYDAGLGEFILKYDDMRSRAEPDTVLMEFLQSTYEVGANLAGWDRAALERPAK